MVGTMTKKVYDFKMDQVKNSLVKVFKKSRNESTVSDLITKTGLPKYQVEQAVKVVSDEYRGHMKATESGELVYYFPNGMHNQVKGFVPAFKRFMKGFFAVTGKILAFLFKIWIVVMLVGYFILFVLILLAALAAALGLSFAGGNRSRGRSSKGGMFFLVIRLFQLFARIWFYGQILKGPQERNKGRPLHKSVFSFVFGEPDPNEEWDTEEKKHVLAYIRSHKGVINIDELMAMTGRNHTDAQNLINRYLLEYEGSPEVTEDGTIVFFFPELLKSASDIGSSQATSLMNPKTKELIPFNYSPKKTNRWIGFFNGFNLVFGSYFAYFAAFEPTLRMVMLDKETLLIDFAFVYRFLNSGLHDIAANPPLLIGIALGIVPLAFSFLFYLIPIIRNSLRKRKNEKIKQENLRKQIYRTILANPAAVVSSAISPAGEGETPKNSGGFIRKTIDELAAVKQADVEAIAADRYSYNFKEIERELKDLVKYRSMVDLSKYNVGETVFDSGA
ncbi:MAG: hypothetical protein JW969_04500 [Spirochaetales bacterium]|nr:hypothetical protein [Spirochaetales bacterium]